MALKANSTAWVMLAMITAGGLCSHVHGQVMPHRASPLCKGQCGSPLTGPCITDAPYAYVPTRWRKWPVMQTSATIMPEELPVPTPAKAPTTEEPKADEPGVESTVPSLPMTPDLPEPMRGPAQPSTSTPPFGTAPAAPPFGEKPQVPVFGDEPQAPPSAADPSAAPFSDEPPQPPADAEQSAPGLGATPGEVPPSAPESAAQPTPAADAAAEDPASGMPFDVGPPKMPSEDPFKDDPNQNELFEPKSGADTEQAQRQSYGLAQFGANSDFGASSGDAEGTNEPRLLHADGGSLEAARLPAQPDDKNPLRQVSHPVRRTIATQAPASQSKPLSTWRRNPLRAE